MFKIFSLDLLMNVVFVVVKVQFKSLSLGFIVFRQLILFFSFELLLLLLLLLLLIILLLLLLVINAFFGIGILLSF